MITHILNGKNEQHRYSLCDYPGNKRTKLEIIVRIYDRGLVSSHSWRLFLVYVAVLWVHAGCPLFTVKAVGRVRKVGRYIAV